MIYVLQIHCSRALKTVYEHLTAIKWALGWVEFLQILLKHSVSRALYFLSSEWCIFWNLKNEFFDISQLLSKLSKCSFGSKLIIFGLELLRMIFFKILTPRATKRPILVQFFQALWQFCAQPISIICTILDSGGKRLSIKNVSAVSAKIQLTLLQEIHNVPELMERGTFWVHIWNKNHAKYWKKDKRIYTCNSKRIIVFMDHRSGQITIIFIRFFFTEFFSNLTLDWTRFEMHQSHIKLMIWAWNF